MLRPAVIASILAVSTAIVVAAPAAAGGSGSSGAPLWIGLVLLLAPLFLLLGFALGRRRPARATA